MLMLPHRGTFFEFVPLDERDRPKPARVPLWEVEQEQAVLDRRHDRVGALRVRARRHRPLHDASSRIRIEFMGRLVGVPLGHAGADDPRRDRARGRATRSRASPAARSTSAPRPTSASMARRSRATCSSSSSTKGPSRRASRSFAAAFDEGLCNENRVYREHRRRRRGHPAPARRRARPRRRQAFLDEITRGNVQGKFPRILDDDEDEAPFVRAHVRRSPSPLMRAAAMNKVGVVIVGVNGAVASTLIAGVELMKRGPRAAHRDGHRAHRRADRRVDHRAARLRPARGPGLRRLGPAVTRTCTRGRSTTRCCRTSSSSRSRTSSSAITPWPAVFARDYVENLDRRQRREREELPRARSRSSSANIEDFKRAQRARARRHGEPRLDRALPRGAAGAQDAGARSRRGSTRTTRRSRRRCATSTSPTSSASRTATSRRASRTSRRSTTQAIETRQPVRGHGRQDRADAAQDGARVDVPRAPSCTSRAGTRPTSSATATGWSSTRRRRTRRRCCQQVSRARLDRGLPRRKPPGSHPLLQAARRLERGLGQHRHRRLRRHPDADQGQLPLLRTRRSRRRSSSISCACSTWPSARASAASSGSSRCSSSRRTRRRARSPCTTSSSRRSSCSTGRARRARSSRAPAAHATAPERTRKTHVVAEGRRVTIALFGGSPTIALGLRIASGRSSGTTSARRSRACSTAASSPARSAPECVALEREFAAYVGREARAPHPLRDERAPPRARRRGDRARATTSSSPPTASWRRRSRVLHCGAIPIFVDVDEATGLHRSGRRRGRDHAANARHHAGARARLRGGHGRRSSSWRERHAARRRSKTRRRRTARPGTASRSARSAAPGPSRFQSSKNLGIGEGGRFVTNDDALAEEANPLRNFGQDVALAERDILRRRAAARRHARARVRAHRLDVPRQRDAGRVRARRAREAPASARSSASENAERLTRALADLPGVSPPSIPRGSTSVHHKFRVRLDPVAAGVKLSPRALRDAMIRALAGRGARGRPLADDARSPRSRSSSGARGTAAAGRGQPIARPTTAPSTRRRASRGRKRSSTARSSSSRSRARSSRRPARRSTTTPRPSRGSGAIAKRSRPGPRARALRPAAPRRLEVARAARSSRGGSARSKRQGRRR